MMNSFVSKPALVEGQVAAAIQVAALCWRLHRRLVEVLLITSRETGRWVIPKGWPINGLSAPESAAREAWEEAGVRGKVDGRPLGEYLYDKVTVPDTARRCSVAVYGLKVDTLKTRFPEAAERRRGWFSASEAAGMVVEPDLQALLTMIADHPDRLDGHDPARPA